MRASPRRSPVWLASPAALLVLVACTPQLDLNDRPPPCAPGYALCASRGVCVHEADLLPEATVEAMKQMREPACPFGLDIRQGASPNVAVPGAAASSNDVTATASWDDDAAVVEPTANGGVTVKVTVPHGTLPGDMAPTGRPYVLTIKATIGGVQTVREIPVIVSPIAASPDGNDLAAGTALNPFKTLAQAAKVAGLGDTILLKLSKDNVAFFDANDSETVSLPAGVSVEGQSPLHPNPKSAPEDGRAKLEMPLELVGDATLANLRLAHRLTLTAEDKKVALNNVTIRSGITVDKRARAAFLRIAGKSEVDTDDQQVNPLLVEADEAVVTIESGAHIEYGGKDNLDLAVVLVTGKRATLRVWDDAMIKTPIAPIAVSSAGEQATIDFDGHETKDGVTVLGRVDILGALSAASIRRSNFALAQNVGGILFRGSELTVTDSEFSTEGIVQDGAGSFAKIRGSRFLGYTRGGYTLKAGRADLGTAAEGGNNKFVKTNETWVGMTEPTALIISAPAPSANAPSATVSMTTFNNDPKPPVACTVNGHESAPGIYDVAEAATLIFY